MATSLAAMTARRAATLARLSPSATRAASLIPRRGLSGASERHAPPKVPIWNWKVPLMDRKLAHSSSEKDGQEVHHFRPWTKQDKEEKVAEPAK